MKAGQKKKAVLKILIAAVLVTLPAGYSFGSCADNTNAPALDPDVVGDPTVGSIAGVNGSSGRRCKGRYEPLRNVRKAYVFVSSGYPPVIYYTRTYDAGSVHAWCWYDGGRIYWRNSDSAWVRLHGAVSKGLDWWPTSVCSAGNRDCLTRRETQAILGGSVTVGPITVDLSTSQWTCAGTRIRNDGSHQRNIYENKRCHEIAASGATATAAGTGQELRTTLTLSELGTRSMRARVTKACARSFKAGRILPDCKRSLKRAYLALSDRERKLLGKKVHHWSF